MGLPSPASTLTQPRAEGNFRGWSREISRVERIRYRNSKKGWAAGLLTRLRPSTGTLNGGEFDVL
jgi:hypothetical protein